MISRRNDFPCVHNTRYFQFGDKNDFLFVSLFFFGILGWMGYAGGMIFFPDDAQMSGNKMERRETWLRSLPQLTYHIFWTIR